jgi:UDP-N-acetylmuramoyl-tripeptide--D-alanyl-D-alanine ligase
VIPLTLHQIADITGGTLLAAGVDPESSIADISTDTRKPQHGALFIAIKGEKHDPHEKLSEAFGNGATAALVERIPALASGDRGEGVAHAMVKVANARLAMGQLATHIRRQLKGKVIAVAGSNGKTSTKYLLHSVLKTKLSGSISPKSFNNDVGVPLAIFPADPQHDYLVLEIGTNHPGEVEHLSKLAEPDIAIITSIAPEHLEGLGDLGGVRREEAAIIAGLNPKGTLIVNGDDAKLLELVGRFPGRTITFGLKEHNDLRASDIRCTEAGIWFTLSDRSNTSRVHIPQLGAHVACNALAVIAAARLLGMADRYIVQALAHAHPPDMRLQLEKLDGLTILNDAYNANPASTRAALETLAALPAEKRRVAILGDMRELGVHTAKYHEETGIFAAHSKVDVLICVGRDAKLIAQAAAEAGMPRGQIHQYPDSPTAAEAVPDALENGDVVLFKASRSVELETVVKAVVAKRQPLGQAAT